MIVTIYFEADHNKLVSSQKSSIFGPQKGHFGQSGPRNGPPGGQTATYQKTEGIQSYLRIWGSYGPIESGPSERKKGGLYGCSVKKSDLLPLFGPKIGPDAPQEPALQHGQHKKVVIFVSRHDGNKKIEGASPKNGFLSKKQHFWPQKGLF